jgi:hypothetical protein
MIWSDPYLLTFEALLIATVVIQVDHLFARLAVRETGDVLLRATICVIACLAVSMGETGAAGLLALVGSCLLAHLYRTASDGLDTADAELWVCLTLAALGIALPEVRSLATLCIGFSIAALYLFAGLNKLRSEAWRDGTALIIVTHGDDDSLAARIVSSIPRPALRALAWAVIAFEVAGLTILFSPIIGAAWFAIVVGFQLGVAVLLGIPSFLIVALALLPLLVAGGTPALGA